MADGWSGAGKEKTGRSEKRGGQVRGPERKEEQRGEDKRCKKRIKGMAAREKSGSRRLGSRGGAGKEEPRGRAER